MSLLVDTSVWSLALRRDSPHDAAEVRALSTALTRGDDVFTCGMVLLELLRGAVPGPVRQAMVSSFASLGWLEPLREDYEAAAELANRCRRAGVQLGTVDALIAQLAIRGDLTLLTTDRDFAHAAAHIPLDVWSGT